MHSCRAPFRGSNQLFSHYSCLQECRMELNAEALLNNTSWSGSDISYPEHISCVVCSRNCNDNFDNFDTEGGVGFNHVQQPWQGSLRLHVWKGKKKSKQDEQKKNKRHTFPTAFVSAHCFTDNWAKFTIRQSHTIRMDVNVGILLFLLSVTSLAQFWVILNIDDQETR